MIHLTRLNQVWHHSVHGSAIIQESLEEVAVSAHEALVLLAKDEGWEQFDPKERAVLLRSRYPGPAFVGGSTGWVEPKKTS